MQLPEAIARRRLTAEDSLRREQRQVPQAGLRLQGCKLQMALRFSIFSLMTLQPFHAWLTYTGVMLLCLQSYALTAAEHCSIWVYINALEVKDHSS
jgi:hypothetical protein